MRKVRSLLFMSLLILGHSQCKKGLNHQNTSSSAQTNLTIKTFSGSPTTTRKGNPPNTELEILDVKNDTAKYLAGPLSTKVIPAAYTVMIIVGVPSNIITLWMLFSHTRSVPTRMLHINLAISDFLFCLMLPFKTAYHLNGNNWVFGEVMCRANTIMFYGNMYSSVFFLMLIGISRYLAIVHPFTYKSLPKRFYITAACILVWLIIFLSMFPFALTHQQYKINATQKITCHEVQLDTGEMSHFQHYYFIFLAIFGFWIPFVVLVFCYTAVIRTLYNYDQKWLWYVRLSILVIVIFAICFMPSNILLIIHHITKFQYNQDNMYSIYLISLCLGSFNSCLDPFIHFTMIQLTTHSRSEQKMFQLSKLVSSEH
ncbi:proteinase-activated receptor 3 [Protopterus annectens]|uniref:proteinase-activated receptor 3 n=1 Tax=Protopterus annectens TaxID=7888 RepID=UPI001CFA7619|nr:proteinase-activated receptor 3 [Protopterus annectens]